MNEQLNSQLIRQRYKYQNIQIKMLEISDIYLKDLNDKINMIQSKLGEKIGSIKAASNFQHKLIDSIYNIMFLKHKAQEDYKSSLEIINRQLQKYIIAENGFLTQIIKSFQSYITVMYQNQKMLIQGYDQEILKFLKTAKQSKIEQSIIEKVQLVDNKVAECIQKIKVVKKLIKDNSQQLELILSQVRIKISQKKFGQKYADISKLKQINEETLQQYVDGMMDLTMLHNQTLQQLTKYQTVHLQEKANQVFDNFMRAFVLQFDVGNILQKVKQKQQQHRKIALDALRIRMKKQDSKIKTFFWDTYKSWTTSSFNISQSYINSRIKQKWKRVCDYYNKAV